MHSHSRKFIALNFVYCCLFFFLNQLSTERRGFPQTLSRRWGWKGYTWVGLSLVTYQVYAHDASKWEQIVTPFAASSGGGIDAPPLPQGGN